MVARKAVVDVVNAKNLDLNEQNYVLAMEIANMLAKKYLFFLEFLGQYLATNMLFSLFLISCCILHLRIMFQ